MAMSHPTRVRILISMNTPRRRLSPKQFAQEAGLSIQHCSYHFGELEDAGCIELVDTRQRRGATEHVYEARRTALAWTSEWKNLKPQVKRGVLDSVMRGALEALGSAIDGGSFEAHDDSHMSWNSIDVDESGWRRMAAIFDRALAELIEVEKECLPRIASGEGYFTASYFMASFESPKKSDLLAGSALGGEAPLQGERTTKDRRRARRRAARQGLDEAQIMAKAMSHPTRVRILISMNTPRRRLSPKRFADETGLPVQHCAYHFRELEDSGCLALVGTRQRRGATEHIYEPRKTALQWTDDWRALGPVVKQSVLASVMRGAVEALGMAIEEGTFEARDDSHLSWSTIKVDAEGWSRMTIVLDRALAELLDLDEEVQARIAAGSDRFVASYFMAGFESPEKIEPLGE
jgi:predicted transcriptional regulator